MKEHDSARPGFIKSKQNRTGQEASFYRIDVPLGVQPSANGRHTPVEAADENTRHAAYSALSDALGLSVAHRAALAARGLSDAEIAAGRFATLPGQDRGKIAMDVLATVKTQGIKPGDLLRVPGFIKRVDVPLAVTGRPGLLIPVMNTVGTITGMMLPPDAPVLDPNAKPLSKYVWHSSSSHGGPGAVVAAHVPPVEHVSGAGFAIVQEPALACVTEGQLKATIAQGKTGVRTIGLPGAGAWKLALPTLEAWRCVTVRLAFDADAATNPNVAGGQARAVRGLIAAGYELEVATWNPKHKGIDDALAAGVAIGVLKGLDAVRHSLNQARKQGKEAYVELDEALAWLGWYLDRGEEKPLFQDAELIEAIRRLRDRDPIEFAKAETRLRKARLWTIFEKIGKQKQATKPAPASLDLPYSERDGCTYSVFQDREKNLVEKPIAGFTARIVKEITRHESGETRRQLEIRATHRDGSQATAIVKAEDFESMGWVPSDLGSMFAIEPGRGTRDMMRHAIQVLSHRDPVERLDVYTSLGWHMVNGERVYLHSGGGIDAAGPVAAHVEAEKSLAPYRLPPPDESQLGVSIRQVFSILTKIGSGAPASVIIGMAYRAVLGPTRTTPHFSGTTGTYKTSTAALAVRFYAPELEHSDPMPATWSSTINGIQRLQHDAGDMLLVLDNLIADGDQASRDLYKADVVFNTQGDLAGRRRMKTDGTLAAVLDPRTSIISTGECDPRRRSALGRSLVVEFEPGTINFDGLKQCHADARAGHYAQTITCYVKHLAAPGRLEAQRQALREMTLEYQAEAIKHTPDCHPRHAEAVAELISAWRLFLAFAVDAGAVEQVEADAHIALAQHNLFGLLAVQASIQTESDPGELFIELVRSLLASKKALLSSTDGTMPPADIAGACGWERVSMGRNGPDWQPAPGAARIGWVDDSYVYFDPSASHAAVERLARDTQQALGSQRQVHTRLAETQRIVLDKQKAGERRRFTRRAVIEKTRQRVVQMNRDEVLDLDVVPAAPSLQPTSGGPY